RVEALPDFSSFDKTFLDENGGSVEPGDSILYTLTLTNNGRAVSTNTVVRDVVNTAFASVTPLDGGTFDAATRTVIWNVGNVAVNDTVVVRFRATLLDVLPANTVVANQGFIDSSEVLDQPSDDPNTPGIDDPTTFPVDSNANVERTTKTVVDVNGGAFQPGDLVSYEITVENTGNAPATNVVVTDPIDPNLTDVTPLDGGVFDG